jgi:hypothetical protein
MFPVTDSNHSRALNLLQNPEIINCLPAAIQIIQAIGVVGGLVSVAKTLKNRAVTQTRLNNEEVYSKLPGSQERERLEKIYKDALSQPGVRGLPLIDYIPSIGQVPGIKLIENFNSSDPDLPTHCDFFVFQNEGWYQAERTADKFFDFVTKKLFRPDSLHFLQKQGYKCVKRPKKGDVVVYFQEKVRHFGRVNEVTSQGKVIVHSKFTDGPVYEHNLEMIPSFYGSHYAFLRKKKF